MRRRQVFAGALLLGGLVGLQLWRRRPGAVAFADHPQLPGFRVLADEAGAVSTGLSAEAFLIGLGPQGTAVPDDLAHAVAEDPLAALYGDAPAPRMAYFTDIRCPVCRPFEDTLAALQAETPALRLITHELPVFGETSTLAARALIAAGPGLAPALRRRLHRSAVVLTEATLAQLIDGLGADPMPVLAGLYAPETDQQLQTSQALANLLGFYGTPALVIGRTAMLGAQSRARLSQVLAAEMRG